MKSVVVSDEKIDIISDVVSRVVTRYADDYMVEGAYINCHLDEEKLVGVDLHIVYIDYRFKLNNFSEETNLVFDDTGISFSVAKDAYWMYSSDNLTNSSLMSGNIIFDKNGNLSEMKRLAKINGVVDQEVVTVPPIQYQYRKVS